MPFYTSVQIFSVYLFIVPSFHSSLIYLIMFLILFPSSAQFQLKKRNELHQVFLFLRSYIYSVRVHLRSRVYSSSTGNFGFIINHSSKLHCCYHYVSPLSLRISIIITYFSFLFDCNPANHNHS